MWSFGDVTRWRKSLSQKESRYVVAYLDAPADFAGGYTKFVLCGLAANCTDHSLIRVTVKSGETAGGVQVKDRYAQPGTFPKRPK